MSINLILSSKVISVFERITCKVFTSSTMFDEERGPRENWLAEVFKSQSRIRMFDLPDCVVSSSRVHIAFLVS